MTAKDPAAPIAMPAATPAADAAAATITVRLDEPIRRGDTLIDAVTLRRPRAGELRGLSLGDLLQMRADAVIDLLPRISQPTLTKPEAANLCPADLVTLGGEVVAFLLPKQALAQLPSA